VKYSTHTALSTIKHADTTPVVTYISHVHSTDISAVEVLDRAIVELTMLSYILIAKTDLNYQMKIPSFRIRDNDKQKTDKQFVCKECKMTFQSKDSLGLHKRKSRHFTGLVYFGKNDG
jgi:hypothetical protein